MFFSCKFRMLQWFGIKDIGCTLCGANECLLLVELGSLGLCCGRLKVEIQLAEFIGVFGSKNYIYIFYAHNLKDNLL